eukprot:7577395-Pyramimonas_sp.AAC.1
MRCERRGLHRERRGLHLRERQLRGGVALEDGRHLAVVPLAGAPDRLRLLREGVLHPLEVLQSALLGKVLVERSRFPFATNRGGPLPRVCVPLDANRREEHLRARGLGHRQHLVLGGGVVGVAGLWDVGQHAALLDPGERHASP